MNRLMKCAYFALKNLLVVERLVLNFSDTWIIHTSSILAIPIIWYVNFGRPLWPSTLTVHFHCPFWPTDEIFRFLWKNLLKLYDRGWKIFSVWAVQKHSKIAIHWKIIWERNRIEDWTKTIDHLTTWYEMFYFESKVQTYSLFIYNLFTTIRSLYSYVCNYFWP